MPHQLSITDRILEEVSQTPECELEYLVRQCSDYPWQDVLIEVRRLHETGELLLAPKGLGVYSVRVCAPGSGNCEAN